MDNDLVGLDSMDDRTERAAQNDGRALIADDARTALYASASGQSVDGAGVEKRRPLYMRRGSTRVAVVAVAVAEEHGVGVRFVCSSVCGAVSPFIPAGCGSTREQSATRPHRTRP